MAHNDIPLVSHGHLLLPDAAEDRQSHILVGSDTWYTWLADEQNRSISFRTPLDTITVRRERQRKGWYWYAYCKRKGKLRKAYLGRTEELTSDPSTTSSASPHVAQPHASPLNTTSSDPR